ncbi:protealysin inhibitor emfourin [Microbacterium betulae]|uniref:protealysin inhibitor emfourin n=1 Tax=Microbacterium betulae TaxID=2981139 RepID=UPI002938ED9F|nr:protealysin inhibitor emfourin [Microbacterium sp. AB]
MRGIVPPFLLERLTAHESATVSQCASRTLTVDDDLRSRRALAAPPAPRARAASAAAGPQRTISDAERTTTLPGRTVRREGDGPTGDTSVDEAYDALGSTWELLNDEYGRDSLDGAGRPLLATVHYGERYDNAFWDGERMVFGDGDGVVFRSFTGAVDVVGHELAHGLIQSTVDLVYQGQSGALNESVADVVGALVKQRELGQTADQADWLIGAGIFAEGVNGSALRSMSAPGTAYDDDALGKDPQPATMAGYVETTSDNGGVHINSGIPNHAFFLAATAIGGSAWEGAGRIWFDVLETRAVAADADFAAFAAATIAAAGARFGDDSAERTAVADAWARVGVGASTAAAPAAPVDDETVRVERSGGLLGRVHVAEVPESSLPGPEREQLESLVGSGALHGLEEDPPVPDAYTWRVEISQRIDVTLGERALPDDVLALLRSILDRGGRRRP